MTVPRLVAIAAVVITLIVVWIAENAAIHAMGYSGFGGAGWITAAIIPIGAAAWVWGLFEIEP